MPFFGLFEEAYEPGVPVMPISLVGVQVARPRLTVAAVARSGLGPAPNATGITLRRSEFDEVRIA